MNTIDNLDFFKRSQYSDEFLKFYAENDLNCEYYTEATFVDGFGGMNNLMLFNANVQSLPSKFLDICNWFDSLKSKNVEPDVLAMQEVWRMLPTHYCIDGYTLFSKCRMVGQGGGVGIYVNNRYNAQVIENNSFFIDHIFESIALEIEIPSKRKFILVSLYRPNCHKTLRVSEQLDKFFNAFINLLENLSSRGLPIYILSDSNIDLLRYGVNENSNKFLNTALSYGFLQLITKATRIQGNSCTLIDHILSNDNVFGVKSGVITEGFSDHFISFSILNQEKPKSLNLFYNSRIFSPHNKSGFRKALAEQRWHNVESCVNVDDAYKAFWETYNTLFELFFPVQSMRRNKNYHAINPFMTKGLLISRKTKLKLARRAKLNASVEVTNQYRMYRNTYNKVLNKSRKLYYDGKVKHSKGDPKKLWEVLKEATNAKSTKNSIDGISVNDVLVSNKGDIANEFNIFFSNIGKKTTEKVPSTSKSFADYLPPPNTNSIFLNPITPGTIVDIMKELVKKPSKDINGISIKFLNGHILEVAQPLAFIFNLSLETGVFPDLMKISKTVPIFKNSNSRLNLNNYRPVSIINCFSKLFEKIVSKNLLGFLIRNDFFYKHQFGFLSNRSTSHALLEIINYVSSAWNNGKLALGVLLDVEKAFDSVDHNILLSKLENAGIRGIALDWFSSYLSGRLQKVVIGDVFSKNCKEIPLGVLQGSILGVILFLVYINDIHSSVDRMFSVIFADDFTGLVSADSLPELESIANTQLKLLANWYRANKLSVHPCKSKYLIFNNNDLKIPANFTVVLNNNDDGFLDASRIFPLNRVTNSNIALKDRSVRVLGIYLDEKLSLAHHVEIVSSKVASSVYGICRVKRFLSRTSLRSLYFANVHSHLNYCNLLFSLLNKSKLNKLFSLQKKAIRAICNANFRAHTKPLFQELRILPLSELIKFNQLTFIFDYLQGKLPESFTNIWKQNFQVNCCYNLRNGRDLFIPALRLKILFKHPLYALPFVWNNFPYDFKELMDRNKFVAHLKSFLLHSLDENFSDNCRCDLCNSHLDHVFDFDINLLALP